MLLPSKTLAAQRRSDSCRAPSQSPNTLHREASSSQKGLGPVRRWWLEIQVPPDRGITGSLSAQALTLDSPPPASIPARLLLLVPTQRMSAHSASSLLADAVYSTEIIAY